MHYVGVHYIVTAHTYVPQWHAQHPSYCMYLSIMHYVGVHYTFVTAHTYVPQWHTLCAMYCIYPSLFWRTPHISYCTCIYVPQWHTLPAMYVIYPSNVRYVGIHQTLVTAHACIQQWHAQHASYWFTHYVQCWRTLQFNCCPYTCTTIALTSDSSLYSHRLHLGTAQSSFFTLESVVKHQGPSSMLPGLRQKLWLPTGERGIKWLSTQVNLHSLLGLCILAICMVTPGWGATCHNTHSRWLCRALPHWEIGPVAPWPSISISHIILIFN